MKTLDDALRDGCEVAGLEARGIPGLYWVNEKLSVDLGHPMLRAYVAELLVAKCCETDEGKRLWRWKFDEISDPNFVHEIWERDVATAQQRILAALVALGHWTLDEAREALKP